MIFPHNTCVSRKPSFWEALLVAPLKKGCTFWCCSLDAVVSSGLFRPQPLFLNCSLINEVKASVFNFEDFTWFEAAFLTHFYTFLTFLMAGWYIGPDVHLRRSSWAFHPGPSLGIDGWWTQGQGLPRLPRWASTRVRVTRKKRQVTWRIWRFWACFGRVLLVGYMIYDMNWCELMWDICFFDLKIWGDHWEQFSGSTWFKYESINFRG